MNPQNNTLTWLLLLVIAVMATAGGMFLYLHHDHPQPYGPSPAPYYPPSNDWRRLSSNEARGIGLPSWPQDSWNRSRQYWAWHTNSRGGYLYDRSAGDLGDGPTGATPASPKPYGDAPTSIGPSIGAGPSKK